MYKHTRASFYPHEWPLQPRSAPRPVGTAYISLVTCPRSVETCENNINIEREQLTLVVLSTLSLVANRSAYAFHSAPAPALSYPRCCSTIYCLVAHGAIITSANDRSSPKKYGPFTCAANLRCASYKSCRAASALSLSCAINNRWYAGSMFLVTWSIQIRTRARSYGSDGSKLGLYVGYASSRNSHNTIDSYNALPLYSTVGTSPLGFSSAGLDQR